MSIRFPFWVDSSRSYTIIETNEGYLQSATYLCSSVFLCPLRFSLNDTPLLSTYLTLSGLIFLSCLFIESDLTSENTKKQFTFHDTRTQQQHSKIRKHSNGSKSWNVWNGMYVVFETKWRHPLYACCACSRHVRARLKLRRLGIRSQN